MEKHLTTEHHTVYEVKVERNMEKRIPTKTPFRNSKFRPHQTGKVNQLSDNSSNRKCARLVSNINSWKEMLPKSRPTLWATVEMNGQRVDWESDVSANIQKLVSLLLMLCGRIALLLCFIFIFFFAVQNTFSHTFIDVLRTYLQTHFVVTEFIFHVLLRVKKRYNFLVVVTQQHDL